MAGMTTPFMVEVTGDVLEAFQHILSDIQRSCETCTQQGTTTDKEITLINEWFTKPQPKTCNDCGGQHSHLGCF